LSHTVTFRIRIKLCGFSFVLYFPVVMIPGLLLMHLPQLHLPAVVVAVVFGGVFVALHAVAALLARVLLQRTTPAVAMLSPWPLAAGAAVGYIVALALEAAAPAVTRAAGNFVVEQICFLTGVFVGSRARD
jgi:hypothetical protein